MMIKIKKRTAAGKVVVRKGRRRPGIARCAGCGKPLHGVPARIPSMMRKLAKTQKRPSRPYGGYYCSECMRAVFREKAKKIFV